MTTATGTEPARIDYRRILHQLYRPGRSPALVDVPPLAYLMIEGRGDPATAAEYTEAMQALFAVAYAAKFTARRDLGINLTVMPLEGLWWADDPAAFGAGGAAADRDAWRWIAMIMQPDEITPELVASAVTTAGAKASAAGGKVPAAALSRLRLERLEEGRCAQVLHVGPYSDEGPTIEQLHAFVAEPGYALTGRHDEVYLGDPRRTAPERLRTVIRQPVTVP